MLRTVLAVAAIAIGVTAVVAQSDPIAARKALMKEMGARPRPAAGMAKGEVPYDQAKAQADLRDLCRRRQRKMPTSSPDNSKTGGETAALPADLGGHGRLQGVGSPSWRAEAKAAQTSVKDLDRFKSAFGGLTKNCGGCHETYRAKKS